MKPSWRLRKHFSFAVMDCLTGRVYGRTGDATTDCIRLAYAVLAVLFVHIDFEPFRGRLHLAYPASVGSFDNVDCLVEMGVVDKVFRGGEVHATAASAVFYCQGWNGPKGHCFFLYHWRDKLWRVEATTGKIDWCYPTTWAEVLADYKELQCGRLSASCFNEGDY